LDPEDFRPEDRLGEEALIPNPIPDVMLIDFLDVMGVEEEVLVVTADEVDFPRMCTVEDEVVVEGNMLDRPSVVVPDLKGELETREFPVTCLKLELVLLGPPPLDRETGIVLLSPSNSPEGWIVV
jgi:hypothetical protein